MIEYLKYINLGLALVSPAIVGVVIGTLLDGKFKVFPFWTVIFLLLGIISGIWSLFKLIKSLV
jgi:F0F1-type ATP synthase assembly protein I